MKPGVQMKINDFEAEPLPGQRPIDSLREGTGR